MEGEEYYKNLLKGSHIPERMHGGIIRYIVNHISPGDFLTAVITNDLREAFDRADDENIIILKRYVCWFYDCAPTSCWGSKEDMAYWLSRRSDHENETV